MNRWDTRTWPKRPVRLAVEGLRLETPLPGEDTYPHKYRYTTSRQKRFANIARLDMTVLQSAPERNGLRGPRASNTHLCEAVCATHWLGKVALLVDNRQH